MGNPVGQDLLLVLAAELFELFSSCLTAFRGHVVGCCGRVCGRSGGNLFWSIGDSGEVLNKLKAGGFNATSLSAYDFSALCTALPHNLIEDWLFGLGEGTFQREGSPCLTCNDRDAFFYLRKA